MRRALAVSMVFVLARLAHADEDASALSRAGVAELRVGSLPEAAAHLRRAAELEPRAATFCNLALTYDRWSGHAHEAREAYLSCAAHDEKGRFREHALERARALEEEIAATPVGPVGPAQPERPTVEVATLLVTSTPAPRARVSHRLAIAGGVLGGVGLACLGAAIGLEVHAGHTLDGLGASSVLPESDRGAFDRAHAESRAGIGLYAATGVLGVSALGLVIADVVHMRRARDQRSPSSR